MRFVCESHNDLFVAAAAADPAVTNATHRFASLAAALAAAREGDGLLLLAEAMRDSVPGKPQNDTTVVVRAADWSAMRAKRLRVYVEFPRTDFCTEAAAAAAAAVEAANLPVVQTMWERAVVTPGGRMGEALPPLALLHPHKHVDMVRLPEAWLAHSSVVMARVAGIELGAPRAVTKTYKNGSISWLK